MFSAVCRKHLQICRILFPVYTTQEMRDCQNSFRVVRARRTGIRKPLQRCFSGFKKAFFSGLAGFRTLLVYEAFSKLLVYAALRY